MARAIVISRAALQQGRDNPRFVKIRRQDHGLGQRNRMSLQKKLATDLQRKAGIPASKLAGLEEADKYTST